MLNLFHYKLNKMPLIKKKSSIYIPKQSLLFQSDIKDSLSFGNLATVPDTKNGKDSMIPLQVFKCDECGHINEEFIPNKDGKKII